MTGAFTIKDDVKNVKYEEYIIEHEISTTQARNVALSTDVNASKYFLIDAKKCLKKNQKYNN